MSKRYLGILLIISAMALSVCGCGNASSNTVSDEDLKMLREMRDELRDENLKLKEANSKIKNESESETHKQEQGDNNAEDTVDKENVDLKTYRLGFRIDYAPLVVSPSGIVADINVNGDDVVYSGNLMKKTISGFESIPDTWTLFNKEDLNSFRNTFIEFYNSYISELQAKIDDVYLNLCEEYVESDSVIEHEFESFPNSVVINVGGKSIDFDVNKVTIYSGGTMKWPNYNGENINRSFRYLDDGTTAEYIAAVYFEIEMESSDTDIVESYFSDMVARADEQLEEYGDFSFIDNTIHIETPSQPFSELIQSEKTEEKKDEPKQ